MFNKQIIYKRLFSKLLEEVEYIKPEVLRFARQTVKAKEPSLSPKARGQVELFRLVVCSDPPIKHPPLYGPNYIQL